MAVVLPRIRTAFLIRICRRMPAIILGVYVYNKNDELVMTYYVHPNLWDAYRVTVDGEIKMLCSNDAMG